MLKAYSYLYPLTLLTQFVNAVRDYVVRVIPSSLAGRIIYPSLTVLSKVIFSKHVFACKLFSNVVCVNKYFFLTELIKQDKFGNYYRSANLNKPRGKSKGSFGKVHFSFSFYSKTNNIFLLINQYLWAETRKGLDIIMYFENVKSENF